MQSALGFQCVRSRFLQGVACVRLYSVRCSRAIWEEEERRPQECYGLYVVVGVVSLFGWPVWCCGPPWCGPCV